MNEISILRTAGAQKVPTPRLVSAQFSTDGYSVHARFDVVTNRALIEQSKFDCSVLFQFYLQSIAASCVWNSDANEVVIFPESESLAKLTL